MSGGYIKNVKQLSKQIALVLLFLMLNNQGKQEVPKFSPDFLNFNSKISMGFTFY